MEGVLYMTILYPNENIENKNTNLCTDSGLRKALKILLNFHHLDLTIDPATAHYGLRFYNLFNRLDAAGGVIPVLKSDNYVYLRADITVPAGYTPRFDNTDRSTIIPVCAITAVAAVVDECGVNDLLRILKKKYDDEICDTICSCDMDLLEALLGCQCDAFNNSIIYEIGVKAIDRSNNPIRGKIVAYDSKLIWVQSTDTDTPPTFYIVPLRDISFVCKV